MEPPTSLCTLQARTEGTIVDKLIASLAQELQLEKEGNPNVSDVPRHLQDALVTTKFQLKDVSGEQEVILTRHLEKETVYVSFSILALSNLVAVSDDSIHTLATYSSTGDPYDTLPDSSEPTDTTKSGRPEGLEHSCPLTDQEKLSHGGVLKSFPVPMNITIKKEGVDGALTFDVVADDGEIRILGIRYCSKEEQAVVNAAVSHYARKTAYTGPPYLSLDEELQRLIEYYLRQRGVDSTLARFVPEYVDYKEQREYLRWLGDVRCFVES